MKDNPFDIFTDEYENWFRENELTFQSELLELEKEDSKFYSHAKFYSVNEMTSMIVNKHFEITDII
jgi:hypothetical protein